MKPLAFEQPQSEWRIDSWSVFDGFAFASEWSQGVPIVTVMISPPDWHIVTITNRSTALLATRGPFQEGFFDAEGEEIAFDSLDEIVELVRRAYLGAGLGLLPPTEGGILPEESGGGTSVLPEPETQKWDEVKELLPSVMTPEDRDNFLDAASRLWTPRDIEGLREGLFEFGQSILIEMEDRFGGKCPLSRADLRDFIAALKLVTSACDVSVRNAYDARHRYGQLPDLWEAWRGDASQPKDVLEGLIFRMPFPRGWWKPQGCHTLGDLLYLSLASRDFLKTIDTPYKFLPLFFCALCITGAGTPLILWRDHDDLLSELIRTASLWLASNLPGTLSPEHPGAIELEKMLRRRIDPDSRGPSSNSNPQPSPPSHPPSSGSSSARLVWEPEDEFEESTNKVQQQKIQIQQSS